MKKLLIGLFILSIIVVGVYQLQKNNPTPPDIAEEDYLILGDEPPFQMKPLPEDQVEVMVDQETAEQIVDVKTDGFRLELDPKFRVVTNELERGRIQVYKGDCRVIVSQIDESKHMKVNEWYQKDKQELKDDIFLDLVSYEIEKIAHPRLEAYVTTIESEQFGIEKEILIQGIDSIYSITQSNKQEVGCISSEEVLDSFHL